MEFSIRDLFSKCDQIRSFLRIRSHLLKLKKSLTENFIFLCSVIDASTQNKILFKILATNMLKTNFGF